ncbi:UNVERIFIED_CONTAM: hypothetical protein Sindi_2312300 [Sesamum indicum]
MDSPKYLSSLTHTSTPQNTHTQALNTTTPAGDEEGAPADGEEVDGDGGRRNTVSRGRFSGEQRDFQAEDEKAPLMERLEEEYNIPSSHGIEEGKDGFLAGKGEILNVDSSPSELGFCAAKVTETSHLEDETNPTRSVKQTIGEDDLQITENGNELLMRKNMNLAPRTKDVEIQKYLGFSENNAAEEDERTRTEKLTHDEFFPTKNGCKTIERDGNDTTMGKNQNLTTVHEKSSLGFVDGAPSKIVNGGHTGNRSPADFNIEEFLRLANKVLDGDEASMEALNNVKLRWEAKFGRFRRYGAAPSPVHNPNPWHCLLSPRRNLLTGKQAETMKQHHSITGLSFSPEIQISPNSGQIPMTERRPPTTTDEMPEVQQSDVEPVGSDVEKSVADMSNDVMHDVGGSADVMHDVVDDVMHDVTADDINDVSNNEEKTSPFPTQVRSFPMGLFVGNIQLNATSNVGVDDKIADAFNNSTRRTLSYIPPIIQNGEVVVRPTMEAIRNGSIKWKTTAIGYFLGRKPYFYHVKEFAFSVWPGLREVKATTNEFFFFQFKTVAYMEEAIEGGPWLFQGQPIVLQKWEPGLVMRKLKHTQIPVWIKLRHLPVELWTEEGLSTVASGIGKPLYPDAITRACTRLDFARTYKPPVTVYIPKTGPARPPPVQDQKERIPPSRGIDKQRDGREYSFVDGRLSREEKGKEIVVYKTFDALHLIDDADEIPRAIWNVRGLNKRDHQLVVKDIIAFRLQFLGLLETRVRFNNVAAIQSFLLPQWKWFVDYGLVGNRVWIAWDDNFLDVDVVECGTQFIHCLVFIRSLHESVALTVIYGASEVADRRELWGALETIAMQNVDVPWLIGGDFNAVRDLSEVCGASGDIRMAMEEFNCCIQNAGLLPLPMQGEWYTWHNCSTNPRNLWKRLDRILINDRWMARFPTSSYTSLTPRTSDHSPLILNGDSQQQFGGMFRFDNYLTLSPEFTLSVQQIWQHNIIGVPMYVVTRKLKALKSVFREQRRKKGDLSHNVPLAKVFLEMAQLLVQTDRRNYSYSWNTGVGLS